MTQRKSRSWLQCPKETAKSISDHRLVVTLRTSLRDIKVGMVWELRMHMGYCTRLNNIPLNSCPSRTCALIHKFDPSQEIQLVTEVSFWNKVGPVPTTMHAQEEKTEIQTCPQAASEDADGDHGIHL